MIGFASDEGTVIRAWTDGDALAREAEPTLAQADMVTESAVERLVCISRHASGGSVAITIQYCPSTSRACRNFSNSTGFWMYVLEPSL